MTFKDDSPKVQEEPAEEPLSSPEEEKETPKPFISFLKELPLLILAAVVAAWLIKTFLFQPFYIPTPSMEPTLKVRDRILVSKLSYRFGQPKQGDIVVFLAPHETNRDFIKRVIATEGQRVQIREGEVFVNNKPQKEPWAQKDHDLTNYGPVTVPKDGIFVMGDNRANSFDSRLFGPLGEEKLIGKALFIYWPPERMGLVH